MLRLLQALPVLVAALAVWAPWAPRLPAPEPAHSAVLVTGASTGIGRHAAKELRKLGFRVYAGIRSQKDLESLKAEGLQPVILDVTQEDTVRSSLAEIQADLRAEKRKLAGLVNCAGVSRRLPLELEDLALVRQLYEVNVFGVTRVTQAFLQLLREAQGRIVNIGSVAALLPHKGSSSYSGSKAALEVMSDALRLEVMPWQISVSLVEPGYVQTPLAEKQMGENAPWRAADPEKRKLYQAWVEATDRSRQEAHDLAPGPEVTSEAILHALTSEFPQTRYVVANVKGIPAWMLAFLGWALPDHLKDLIVKRF